MNWTHEARRRLQQGQPAADAVNEQAVHVLVVASGAERRQRLRVALEEDGHVVRVAQSGREAAQILGRPVRPPDVIVLDMRLRPGDGAAFATAYRDARGTHPPIVLVAAPGLEVAAAEEMGHRDGTEQVDSDPAYSRAALLLLRARVRLHGRAPAPAPSRWGGVVGARGSGGAPRRWRSPRWAWRAPRSRIRRSVC